MRIAWLGCAVGAAAAMFWSVAPARADIKIAIAGPLTGPQQFLGEEQQTGAQKAIDYLNSNMGVLGQHLEVVLADDGCDPKQAEAAARQLVNQGVVFVVGHMCSGSSIPASKIYQAAGIVMISPGSTAPNLTDQGGSAIFRLIGRDDQQGPIAGDYLADHYANARIAILNDGQIDGLGLAQRTKEQMNKRGVSEVMFESYAPSQPDYASLVEKLVEAKVDVLYVGGYASDIAIIIRQAKRKLPNLQLISGDTLATSDFEMVAGQAGEGAYFTFGPDPRLRPQAAPIVATFTVDSYDPAGFTLYSYAAVQTWAQAVKQAGSLKSADVIGALHKGKFDTVIGTIGFNEKGDVTGIANFSWYVVGGDGWAPVK